jgi:hypothetical protein
VIVNRSVDRWFILILPIGLFVALSVRPVMRLRVDAPAKFLEPDAAWDARRRVAEEELARGYWKSVVGSVQWEYGYGTNLPSGPPDDFRVEESGLHTEGLERDPATRMRYWAKFRQVWIMPQTWEKSYGWDTGWVLRTIEDVRDWLLRAWERIFYRG